ncbi:helix-turn-helix domain-containing protein [Sphingopyxis terrae subsp. ummariensis]
MKDNDDEIARARAARHGTPFLNTEQAAAYLGLGPRKLQYMRAAGEGPPYRRTDLSEPRKSIPMRRAACTG